MQCPHQVLLFLLLWTAHSFCSSAVERPVAAVVVTPLIPAVCPYRTVNYITHSLPQRCLTSSRSASSGIILTAAAGSVEGSSHTSRFPSTTTHSSYPPSTSVHTREEEASDSRVVQPPTSANLSDEETDPDSPLSKDNFLSFEEWKIRNLNKYGQSPDQVGKAPKHDNFQARRRQAENVLDSLGDDAEIDLDFTTFASEKPQVAIPKPKDALNTEAGGPNQGKDIPNTLRRSNDAGTTFKERFNYASFDCAATILKTNSKSSGSSAVLVENKDRYMLNECSVENKFLILELCEDILIDTIVLANFEFFSSIFRTFRVSVSDRYPVRLEKWKVLGTFEARNTREVQAFLIVNPLIWAKYVRIEFLTHYGNEFYCPLSLVRVHGTTMLEDYRHDEDDAVTETYDSAETVVPEANAEMQVEEENLTGVTQQDPAPAVSMSTVDSAIPSSKPTTSSLNHGINTSDAPVAECLTSSTRNTNASILDISHQQCLSGDAEAEEATKSPITHRSEPSGTYNRASSSHLVPTMNSTVEKVQEQESADVSQSASSHSFQSTDQIVSPKTSTSKQSVQATNPPVPIRSTGAQGSDSSKASASSTQPPPSNPTIQESFFKSVQKRLQMLETNSTLSLQYIEEQSRILRDAFGKVEQRQLSRTTKFLDYLNGTVLNELRDFRQQYDQLWQSTVIELETQREQSQREVITIKTQLGILTDELLFQKRMAVIQCVLVLLCIALVLFPRGAMHTYLEHPLLQNMLTRSATLKVRGSFLDTPNQSPDSTRPNSSYRAPPKPAYSRVRKGHRRHLSDDSQDVLNSPAAIAIAYSPPTPASEDDQSEVEDGEKSPAACESPSRSLTSSPRSSSSLPDIHHSTADIPNTPPTHLTSEKGEQDPSQVDDIQLPADDYSHDDNPLTLSPRLPQPATNG
jgi:Sad1 / UNC-like C-terminal